jgi:hypothetical protein
MPRGLVQLDLKSRGSTLGGDVSSFVLLRHVFHSTAFDEVHLTSMLLHRFSSLIMSLADNVTELLGKGVNQSSTVVQSRPSPLAAELSNETNGLPIAHTISILLTAMLQPDPRCAPTNPPLTTPTCPL